MSSSGLAERDGSHQPHAEGMVSAPGLVLASAIAWRRLNTPATREVGSPSVLTTSESAARVAPNSYAPMSASRRHALKTALIGRQCIQIRAASIAGLPASSANVNVGPPLSCSGRDWGSHW